MQAIIVIDHTVGTVFIYDVEEALLNEQTEEILIEKGHHLSSCSWGEFDGTINDKRDE